MTFVLICIGALILLGGVAALLSRGDDTPIQQGHDCSTCLSRDDGSCKIKCLLDDLKEKGDQPKSYLSGENLQSRETPDSKTNKDSLHKQGRATVWLLISLLLLIASCSTEKNTSQSRWWHSFTARYNIYYNGNLAYIDAALEKEQGNKDNFTELIPLYTVSNKNSKKSARAISTEPSRNRRKPSSCTASSGVPPGTKAARRPNAISSGSHAGSITHFSGKHGC